LFLKRLAGNVHLSFQDDEKLGTHYESVPYCCTTQFRSAECQGSPP
jgi:hypothetical protein